jgi:pimeloyl-ACP methyl ester carboxylesterase
MQRLIGGATVEVEDIGNGMPILFIHGFEIDHRSLLYTLGPLFEGRTGYRRIHIDLPGFGASPWVPTIVSSDAMVDFVLTVIDEMVGSEPLLIVGESWGGYLARGVVTHRPEQIRGLALLYPVVVALAADREVPDHRVLYETPGALDEATPAEADEYRENLVVVDHGSRDYFHEAIAPAIRAADPAAVERIRSAYAFATDPDSAGDPYPGPALVVTGRQDANVGYRDALGILERLPRATFAVLDEAGHGLLGERPQVTTALVNDWLDRVERAERG